MEATVKEFKSLVELHKFEKANKSLALINLDYNHTSKIWTATFNSPENL